MKRKMGVGIVGCGNISYIYFQTLCKRFPWIEVVACSDLMAERAQAKAREYSVPKHYSTEELLKDDSVDIVLNLTTPELHARINRMALKAGKHVYCEKPLAINRKDAAATLSLARKKGLLVGCAPDTFLGAGIQECRKIIDDGIIGKVVSAEGFMVGHGHESWHPDPEFYYRRGGGPMLDMGPYYMTALVNLVDPIRSISGMVGSAFKTRTITSKKKYGKKIRVQTPTHLSGSIGFENGAIGTMIMSFDVWRSVLPRIEIHGEKGSLHVPDPNNFGGRIGLFVGGRKTWRDMRVDSRCYGVNSRGIGLADMALAIMQKRKHRASGELAHHVLDAMLSFEESSINGKTKLLTVPREKPKAMPAGLRSRGKW